MGLASLGRANSGCGRGALLTLSLAILREQSC
jgi:hypothetical protein